MYAGLESPVREYLPDQGRFNRPDPLGLGAVNLGDPGSWNRFTGNVVVVVAPGPHDVVVVVRYAKGKPEQVFAESTHGEISVLSTGNRVTVKIGLTENTRSKTRAFEVDEDELRRG
jgi:hypothetical protein